jgi:hypothetical protein
MSKLTTRLATVALSVAVAFTSFMPASAMSLPRVEAQGQSDVIRVQEQGSRVDSFRWRQRHHDGRRGDRWNRGDRWDRRADRRWDRRDDRRGWYNGHRGYSHRRHGHRYHDGYWFPLAAFGAGAIIGGAISQPRATYSGSLSPSHVNWCANRYRTYRASDNTYVPRAGTRAYCNSPYS